MTLSPTNDERLLSNGQITGITVLSLFPDSSGAESAVRELKQIGFTDQEIGVLMQEPGKATFDSDNEPGGRESEGTAAVDESLAGGLIGLLATLLIPGMGPLLLGGVLASTLAGAGVDAAASGLMSIVIGLGASRVAAEYFERGVRNGGILVTVNAAERTSGVVALLEKYGADLGRPNRRSGDDRGYHGPERRLLAV
jgi:hypothetical protein